MRTRRKTRFGLTVSTLLILGYLAAGWALVSVGDLLVLPLFAVLGIAWLAGALVVASTRLFSEFIVPGVNGVTRLAGLVWRAFDDDELGVTVKAKLSRLGQRLAVFGPLARRVVRWLTPGRTGLRRTGWTLLASASMMSLLVLSRMVSDPRSALVAVDVRFASLAEHLAAPVESKLMLGLTNAGRTDIVVAMIAIVVVGAVVAKKWSAALLLISVTATSAATVTVLKLLVARARPDLGALVETSASWPSGHSAASVALVIGLVTAWRAAGYRRWKLAAAVLLPIGMLVGYSRAYLTVHWASDVLGGWGVAVFAGSLVMAADTYINRRDVDPSSKSPALLGASALAIGVFVVAAVVGSSGTLPVLPVVPHVALSSMDPVAALDGLSPFSETLTGSRIEPIGLVVSASREQLLSAVDAAGWSVADPPTVRHLIDAYAAGIRRIEDLSAPVTPTFFGGRMLDLAIEKPVEGSTVGIRERHHARFWQLEVTTADGCPIWVGTASFDDTVSWSWRTVLPNHHIAPAIDVEQAIVATDLESTGILHLVGTTTVTEPTLGTNAAGDEWFTNGNASVLASVAPCEP